MYIKNIGNCNNLFTHFSADSAMQTDSVKMREFHNMNCEWNIAILIDFKT